MRFRLYFIFLLFFSGFSLDLAAQPKQLGIAKASLSGTSIKIGDQVKLTIQISIPTASSINEIDYTTAFADNPAEIVEISPLQTLAETPELLLQQVLTLQLFDTGYVFTPVLQIPLLYPNGSTDTLRTESLLLTVTGIPVEEDADLMPIKPIIKEPLRWTDFWPLYMAAIVLSFAYLAFAYWRKKKKVRPAPVLIQRPAHLLALEQLDTLASRNLWQEGLIPEYYTELSYIFRNYLELRFEIPAKESTSKEIIKALSGKRLIDEAQKQELARLLQLSDLVKFAKAKPGESIHEQSLGSVRQFIQEQANKEQALETIQNEEK